MSIRLRFALDLEFDSTETAKAYGVALGWALTNISTEALALSEAPAPALAREPVKVLMLEAEG